MFWRKTNGRDRPSDKPKGDVALLTSGESSLDLELIAQEYPETIRLRADLPELKLTFVSDNAVAMLGYPKEEWLASVNLFEQHIHAQDRQRVVAQRLRVANERKSYQIEYRMLASDGRILWFNERGRPYVDEGQDREQLLVLMINISHQKRLEQHLRVQSAISAILAESPDLEQASGQLLQSICEALGWELGELWTVDEAAGLLRCQSVWHDPSIGPAEFIKSTLDTTFPPGVGLPSLVWAGGEPLWSTDVSQDGNFVRAAEASTDGLRTAFFFPIKNGPSVRGVLCFYSREIQEADNELLKLASSIGQQIGLFVERKYAQAVLQASESRNRAILESALDCIITIDHEGKIIEFNPAAEATFGYTKVEAIGRRMAELIVPPALREQHRRSFERQLATGGSNILGRRIEMPALRADGSEFPVELSIVRIDTTGSPTFTAYIRDITERKQAEEVLRDSNERLSLAMQIGRMGAWEWDVRTNRVTWSETLEEIHGLAPGAFGGTFDDYQRDIHPDDRQRVLDTITRALEAGTHEMEYRIILPDGGVRWLEARGFLARDWDGTPLKMVGICRDVTDRVLAQARLARNLEQTEAIYRLVAAISQAESLEEVYAHALEGIIRSLKVDRAALLLFDENDVMQFVAWRGLSDAYRAATAGHTPWTQATVNPQPVLVPDALADESLARLRDVMANEGVRALAFIPLVASGRLIGKFMLYHNAPHNHAEEEIQLAQSIAGNLAFAIERRQSAEKLKRAEELYRSIFENATVGISQTTPDGKFLAANAALARMLGYESVEELMASIGDIGSQLYVNPQERQHYMRELQQKGAVSDFQTSLRRKDGGLIRISVSSRALHDEVGNVYAIEGVIQDITERRRAEEALRASEERYRTLFDSAPVSIWEEDFSAVKRLIEELKAQGINDFRAFFNEHPEVVQQAIGLVRIIDVNEETLRVYTTDAKEELFSSLENVLRPESMAAFTEQLIAIAEGQRFLSSEATVQTIKGEPRHVLFQISFPEPDGDFSRILISIIDVTARKRAEEALRESEERYRAVFENALSGIMLAQGSTIVDANPAMCAMLGRERDELVGLSTRELIAAGAEETEVELRVAVAEMGYWRGEVPVLKKDGTVIDVELQMIAGPLPGLVVSVANDITERKRAEEALRRAEENYRSIFENAIFGIFQTTPESRFIAANQALARILGYDSPEDLIANITDSGRQIYVDPRRRSEFARLLQIEGFVSGFEAQAYRKDGSTIWISLTARTLLDANGQLYGFEGILEDITERKRLEEQTVQLLSEVQAEKARVDNIIATVPGVVWETRGSPADPQQRTVYISSYAETLYGYPLTEWYDRPGFIMDIMHPDDREQAFTDRLNIFESGEEGSFQFRVYTKDGRVLWTETNAIVVKDAADVPIGMRGVTVDVTEWKRLEEETQHLLEGEQAARKEAERAVRTVANIQRVTDTALAHLTMDELLKELLLRLREILHAETATILLLEEDTQNLVGHTFSGLGEGVTDRMIVPLGSGIAWRIAQSRQVTVIDDLSQVEVATPWLREHVRSLVGAPLIAEGQLVGVVHVGTTEPRQFQEDETRLLELVADRIAVAIDHARLYERETILREEAEAIQAELRKANEDKDEFLGLVSHELRTPITSIYGGIRILRSRGDRLDEETRAGVMTDLEYETERLHRLVEDLLVLARLELGQEVEKEPVLLQRTLDKIIASFQHRRPNRNILLEVPADLPPVEAIPLYIEQITRNLLSNADKYSDQDKPINVTAIRNGESEVIISVLDRGVGVAPEEAPHLFERFFRTDRAARKAQGIGIGLTVCKRLVEAQDGRIWAQPREGDGLEVSFTLPVSEEEAQ